MMKDYNIPIPTQIIEIIGEKNVADVYGKESSGESSDVEVWNTNVNTFKIFKTCKNKKRPVILKHLRTFQRYYSENNAAKGRKGSSERESGYDSKDVVSAEDLPKRKKANMPRGKSPAPSSQLDMFSTRSPSKVRKDSISKKKVDRMKPAKQLKHEKSSSDEESSDKRSLKKTFAPSLYGLRSKNIGQKDNSSSESDSDSSSNGSSSESKKSSRPTVNDLNSDVVGSGPSEVNSTSQVSEKQVKIRSSSSESDHEIIPATQDIPQTLSKSFLDVGVGQPKRAKLDSPLKSPRKENRNVGESPKSLKSLPIRTSESGSSSDSEDDSEKVLLINKPLLSNSPKSLQNAESSSDDSDSSKSETSTKNKNCIPPQQIVSKSTPHSSDSEDSSDADDGAVLSGSTPATLTKTETAVSHSSDSEDDKTPAEPSNTNVGAKSNNQTPQCSVPSKNNKDIPPGGIVSKTIPHSSDSEDSSDADDGAVLTGSTPATLTKTETAVSHSSDSEDDKTPAEPSNTNVGAKSSNQTPQCSVPSKNNKDIPPGGIVSKTIPHSSDSEDSSDADDGAVLTGSTPATLTKTETAVSHSSDSEDDKTPAEPSNTNVGAKSNNQTLQRSESSDDSDSSEEESSSKKNKVTPPEGIIGKSIPRSSDSSSSESEDDERPAEPSNTNVGAKSSNQTPQSSVPSKNNKDIPPGGIVSKTIPHSSDSEDSDDSDRPNMSSSSSSKRTEKVGLSSSTASKIKNNTPYQDSYSKQSMKQSSKISLSNNSRKRKADTISSSDESDSEPKTKSRKTLGTSENVPFNSTRISPSDEMSFPGSDISVIPKMTEPQNSQVSASPTPSKGAGSQMPKSSQLSIREFAKPTNPVGQLSNLSGYEALKQEYLKSGMPPGSCAKRKQKIVARQEIGFPTNKLIGTRTEKEKENWCRAVTGKEKDLSDRRLEDLIQSDDRKSPVDAFLFSTLKEYDYESYDGLLEEDLLDKDVEVYVVQCPKEVDPNSLVGQEIDVSNKESFVDLTVTGGNKVCHDVYCDLSETEYGINVIVPSRTKKKFTLNSVPVSGRVTVVESLNVPQIEEFDTSSPPPVAFPENLKARNTFIGSDESSAQSISEKSNRSKRKKEERGGNEVKAPVILDTYETPKYERVDEYETSSQKRKNKKSKDRGLDDSIIYAASTMENVEETQNGEKIESVEVSPNKKKKKKRERKENNDELITIVDEKDEPPPVVPLEEPLVKKKKKKRKHESDEPFVSTKTELSIKEEFPPTSIPDDEPIVEKKKKKKKRHASDESVGTPDDEPIVEKKKKKKKRHASDEPVGIPDDEPIVEKKKKKKKKRESDESDGSTNSGLLMKEEPLSPSKGAYAEETTVEKKKKNKRKHQLEELQEESPEDRKKIDLLNGNSFSVDINTDDSMASEKRKKKKKKKHKIDVP